jgi:hypothetical protein
MCGRFAIRRTVGGWGARRAARAVCAAVSLVAVVVPAARADVTDSFTQPGSYGVVAPPNAYLADITVAGASGTDGGVVFPPFHPGGVGGLGTTVSEAIL